MRNPILFIVLFFAGAFLQAQPSAPAAGNLSSANFVDLPVSPFTGTISYSIPMGAVTSGSLSLGISLDYHSGANKVGTIPGPAGLGWDLNVGGGITRTVRGIRDEEPGGYWNSPTPNTGQLTGSALIDHQNGNTDGEPDILTWRIPGKGGKFYLDRNHQIVQLSKTDVKVIMLSPSNSDDPFELGFEIVNSDGTIYRFNHANYQRDNLTVAPYVIGWVLTRIQSYDLYDEIVFNYGTKQSYWYKALNMPTFSGHDASDFDFVTTMGGIPHDIEVVEQKLESIVGLQNAAQFTYNVRADLAECIPCLNLTSCCGPLTKEAYSIANISFSAGSYCYKYFFTTDYFKNQYGSNVPDAVQLRLTKVQKKSCNGSIVENPYSFEYNGEIFSNGFQYFPFDLNKDFDHFGYYNKQSGYNNNQGSKNMIQSGTNAFGVAVGNSNRLPYAPSAEVGLLNKITTPTKGIIQYTYEGNDYAYTNLNPPLFSLVDDCLIQNEVTSDPILFDNDLHDSGQLKLTQTWQNYSQGGNCMNQVPHYIRYKIRDASTNAVVYQQTFYSWQYAGGTQTYYVNLSNIAALQVGTTYKFSMFVWNTEGTMELKAGEITGEGGGVRIKEIKTWDGVDQNTLNWKKFHYDKFDTPGESSGFLVAEPSYKQGFGNTGGIVCSAFSHQPLTNIDGLTLGYKNVKVEQVGLGFTKYVFERDSDPISPGYPAKPNEDLSGNPVSSSTLDAQSNVVGSTSNTFSRNDVYSDFFHITTVLDGEVLYNDYKLKTKRFVYLNSSTAEQEGISSTTNYTYLLNATPHIMGPIETSTTNSDGVVYKQKSFYSGHYAEDATIKNRLRALNINIPYKTSSETSAQIGGSRTQFKIFAASGSPTCSSCSGYPRPHKLERYERTWDEQGTLSSGSWETTKTFRKYAHLGKLTEYQDDQYDYTYLSYFSNTYNVASKNYLGYISSFTYFPNSNLLKVKTDVDGTTMTYAYDDLMRLESVSEDCKGITSEYAYYFSPDGSNNKHYTKKSILFSGAYNSNSALSNLEEFTYYDNLGRAIQNVRKAQSPNNKDIVTANEYDHYGRMVKSYLPVESPNSNGNFLSMQSAWKHTLHQYEASPLSRKNSETPADWYASTYSYGGNLSSDLVKDPQTNFAYPANSLMKATAVDPNGNKSISFTDKLGRQVLTRQTNSSGGGKKDTYYKYDGKGRLSAVVAPGSNWSQAHLNYYYYYDGNDNLVKKNIPSRGATKYIYNDKNLLAAWQDENMGTNQWMGFTYDLFGRELKSGFINSSFISNVNNPTLSEALTENIYGTNGIEKGKIKTVKSKILGTSNWLSSTNNYDGCGRLTNTSGNNHMNIGNNAALTSSYIYDKGDNLTESTAAINSASATNTIRHIDEYDHIGRNTANSFQFNNGTPTKLSEQVYNHREELITKYQGYVSSENPVFLQEINYFYKSNGLLDRINQPHYTEITPYTSCNTTPNPTNYSNYDNKDLFYLQLHYDAPIPGTTVSSRKNGEISGARWQTKGRSFQQYAYSYDHLGQLTSAKYYDFNHSTNQVVNTDRYTTSYGYDIRGNILSLNRFGALDGPKCFAKVNYDQLLYSYTSGNRVNSITDYASGKAQYSFINKPGNYTYDANGNLTSDPYKGITLILYNHLDKPTEVHKAGQSKIKFTYDANGTMLHKEIYDYNGNLIEGRDYIGGVEYVSGTLESVMHSEGRYFKTGIYTGRHEYNFKDHLGNTRLVYSDLNGDGVIKVDSEILQESHFYPYGMEMKGNYLQSSGTDYRYKYNDIEREGALNLGIDFAFYRSLDPVIGRWMQVDPKGELLYGFSGYHSMGNNPISNIDPDGDFWHIVGGAVVGGVFNVWKNWDNIKSPKDFFAAAGIGMAAGAVGAIAGPAAATAILGATTTAAAAVVLSGGVTVAAGLGVDQLIQETGNALYFGDADIAEALGEGIASGAKALPVGFAIGAGISSLGLAAGAFNVGTITEIAGKVDDAHVIFAETGTNVITTTVNKTAGGGVAVVGKGGTKLLTQFSKSTIDDATAYAMRTQNNIDHIFAAKHKLGSLVNRLGGQRNTINAALNAGNGKFPTSGVFRMQVNAGGQNVWIKGAVHNGIPKLGTMWIP